MFKSRLCILMVVIYYLDYLWKSFQEPIVYLTFQKCHIKQLTPSTSTIRSFFFEQYQKFIALFSNSSSYLNIQQQCHHYKINLHLSVTFFILKYLCIVYCLIIFFRILLWFYEKLCFYILQKQMHPFVHIRSVALVSQKV